LSESFGRVHFFPFRSEGAVLLSSPRPREQAAPYETVAAWHCAGGRRSTKQPRDTRRNSEGTDGYDLSGSPRGARMRGATRSAMTAGMNTTEIDESDYADELLTE